MHYFAALCLAAGIFVTAQAQPLSNKEASHWNHFKETHGKFYNSLGEELLRQQIFLSNLQKIEEHNKLYEEGKTTYKLKMNKFGDMTTNEFKEQMNGYRMGTSNSQTPVYTAKANEELPSSVDWRTKGAVTGVKNQALCGSCWAFSATGSLEGQTFLKTGKLVPISEQNLLDCSTKYGNEGCGGGWMDWGFQYIKDNGGIDTEESYPYEAQDGDCRFKKGSIGATLTNYTDVEAKNEAALQSAVANVGPVSVAIDAGAMSFQFYSSGIYYEKSCNPDVLDHGVLAVGYGSNSNGDYWIVKNSWGADWGDKGYILMARNKNNNCGIATKASYPNV